MAENGSAAPEPESPVMVPVTLLPSGWEERIDANGKIISVM